MKHVNQDITQVATITAEDVLKAEQDYVLTKEAHADLERFIGTYETYGGWSNVKPDYSPLAFNYSNLLKGA